MADKTPPNFLGGVLSCAIKGWRIKLRTVSRCPFCDIYPTVRARQGKCSPKYKMVLGSFRLMVGTPQGVPASILGLRRLIKRLGRVHQNQEIQKSKIRRAF